MSTNAIFIMLFTNTNTTFLIFLPYLIFTEFEPPSMICRCQPRRTSLFPMKARQQADPPREDSQRKVPLPVFFFFFFWQGPWLVYTFFNLGGGTPWVVTTSGLLPDDTGIPWDISKFGESKPALSFLYSSSESTIQINICLFQR